jgi:hypothetical protein
MDTHIKNATALLKVSRAKDKKAEAKRVQEERETDLMQCGRNSRHARRHGQRLRLRRLLERAIVPKH